MIQRVLLLFFIFLTSFQGVIAQPQTSYSSADITHMIEKLPVIGSVLYVAAHPDDENTRLLAFLANERKYRTAYISLTRGDGGQNLIGNEQGPLLGLIRSHELMAARKIDKAEQFFTRAYDFGYSKSPEETFDIWNRDSVLADMVYIIRYYKPDILLTRFSSDGTGGHGHHTASAILAADAFEAASDPSRFPDQLQEVDVWQVRRLLYNNAGRFRNPDADMSGNIPLNVGKYNPLIGRSYGEIAGLSRSMHKSQGFGSYNAKGEIIEYFKPISGDIPTKDIFENIDVSLNRIEGGEQFEKSVENIMSNYKPSKPELIVPYLLEALKAIKEFQDPFWKKIKKKEVEDLIIACTGLWFEINSTDPFLQNNDTTSLNILAINRSELDIEISSILVNSTNFTIDQPLINNVLFQNKINLTINNRKDFTGPYWLNDSPSGGLFQLSENSQLQKPVDDGHINAAISLRIGNSNILINRPILYKWVDPTQGEQFRLAEIVPPAMINIPENTIIFTKPELKTFKVQVRAGTNDLKGVLRLNLPKGLTSIPKEIPIEIALKNSEMIYEFQLVPDMWFKSEKIEIIAEAQVQGKVYRNGFREIKYDHIPIQVLYPVSRAYVVLVDMPKTNGSIGYIQGAGDDVAKGLRQMGYSVTEIAADDIDKINLSAFKALVFGIRAFNTSERLVANLPLFHKYVESGGTVVVQYNTNSWAGPLRAEFGPYPMKLGRGRVTDEKSDVILDSTDPILNFPNKLSVADFDGWIQERGLYFASEWDDVYRTPLRMADPDEKEQLGSLLIANHGKGQFIYTGISFFRQIPHGVPGAFRLLNNLIESGSTYP